VADADAQLNFCNKQVRKLVLHRNISDDGALSWKNIIILRKDLNLKVALLQHRNIEILVVYTARLPHT